MNKKVYILEIEDPLYQTDITDEVAEELKDILVDALRDYNSSGIESPKEWSTQYFINQLLKEEESEISEWSDEIDETLNQIKKKRKEQQQFQEDGFTPIDWFAANLQKDIGTTAAHVGSQGATAYISEIDIATSNINDVLEYALKTQSNNINQNPHLHGSIAEAHHVNSYNANAAASGSTFRAEMLRSNKKKFC